MSHALCCWCQSPLIKLSEHWWCGGTAECRQRQMAHAQFLHSKKGALKEFLYVPLPKQTTWHEATYLRDVTRLLVGGAAGPGKSTFIRRAHYEFATLVPGFHGLIVRKSIPDLKKSHLMFLPHEVTQLGGRWLEGDKIAVFKHKGQMDSVIRAGHFEDRKAIEDYLSAQFDLISPDEVVTMEKDPTLELFTRARSTNTALFELRGRPHDDPEQVLDGSFVLGGTNPGGRMWVKDHWISKAPDPEEHPNYDPAKWLFLDAKLKDNPYITGGYVQSLRDMRESRRKQLEDGDWDAFEGQMFSEWTPRKMGKPWHVQTYEELVGSHL